MFNKINQTTFRVLLVVFLIVFFLILLIIFLIIFLIIILCCIGAFVFIVWGGAHSSIVLTATR